MLMRGGLLRTVASAVVLTAMAFPDSAFSLSWHSRNVPLPAIGNGQLIAVSCPSARVCAAIGSYTNAAHTEVPLGEIWNGRRWFVRLPTLPAGAASARLQAISCPSAVTCTAVGYLITAAHAHLPLVERWDGGRWTMQPVPVPTGATQGELGGIACVGGGCRAVGWSAIVKGPHVALAEHDRGGWTIDPLPIPATARQTSLSGVSCTKPSACIAVGYADVAGPLIEHFNGSAWRMQRSASRGVLNAVSCTSARACTAVGSYGSRPVAERFDGTTWAAQRAANAPPANLNGEFTGAGTTTALRGVSCMTDRFCTAVGSIDTTYYCESDSCPAQTTMMIAERFNGTRWTVSLVPDPNGVDTIENPLMFTGVSCASRRVCVAVGPRVDSTSQLNRTFVERWQTDRWRVQSAPNPAGPADGEGGNLTAIACQSATECLSVGSFTKTATVRGRPRCCSRSAGTAARGPGRPCLQSMPRYRRAAS